MKIDSFSKKLNWKIFKWILICSITIAIGTYIRLYPLRSHMWSDTHEKATLLVVTQVKSVLRQQLAQQFPNLPESEFNRLLDKKFNEVLRQNSQKVRETIQSISKNLSNDSPSQLERFYLLESDSFYYYALTKNILQSGRIGAQQQGGKYFEPLMNAPFGYWQPITYHPYIGMMIYKCLHFFNSNIDLMFAVGFTPIIISILATIVFVSLCQYLNCSALGTWVGAIFLSLAPIFLKRSAYGWYDSDPYNILFPLLILWIFFVSLKETIHQNRILKSGILCALGITIYSLFWHGWGFVLMILIGSLGIFIIGALINKDIQTVKKLIFLCIAIVLGTILGTCLIYGVHGFSTLINDAVGELKKFTIHESSLWPDLFIGVGELNKPTLKEIIDYLGGRVFIGIALFGILTTLITAWFQKDIFLRLKITTLSLFLASTFLITLGAQRFILLSLVPFSLFFTFGIDAVLKRINHIPFPSIKNLNIISIILCFLVASTLVFFSFYNSLQSIKSILNPIFNSAWEEALITIKNKTPPNSIIDSWWPPGHFIKAIAERRVLFDGATLNLGTKGYWLAQALLSQDEKQASGILRMLNGSGNEAVEYLVQEGMHLWQAVALIQNLTLKDLDEAQVFLDPLLTKTQINHLLELTHKTPAPTYLLIYNELAEKVLGLEFVGKWNFQQMEKISADSLLKKSLPAQGSSEYIRYLWEIMGGAYRVSETLNLLSSENETLHFTQDVFINLKNMSCVINSPQYGQGVPQSIIYLENGYVIEKLQKSANLNYSVVLLNDNSYQAILMDRALANSLIVKLFYFQGQGLKYFKHFTSSRDLTGRTQINVFELIWD